MWCSACGLNLTQQGDLPTADAYAAGVREQRWLAAQAEEAEATKAEQARALQERRAAESEQRAREERERKQARAEEAARKRAERRPQRKKWIVGLASALVVLLVGGAAAFSIFQARGGDEAPPQAADRTDAREKSPAPEPPSTPPRCSRRTAGRELKRRNLLDESFPGVSRVICRDFTGDGAKDAAFTRESLGSAGILGWGILVAEPDGTWQLPLFRENEAQVGIKADGSDLLRSRPLADEADPSYQAGAGAKIRVYRYIGGQFRKESEYRESGEAFPAGFYPESDTTEESSGVAECGDSDPAPITNVTAENIECETAFEVAEDQVQAEQEGWSCTDTDTGYESSSTVCTKGEARVTWDFAV